jgi:hypothetical protein
VIVAAAVCLTLAGTACGSDDDSSAGESADTEMIRLWIEPERADCEDGAGLQECLQIARSEGGDVELFYDEIEGFDFEEGTSYVIDVAVDDIDDPPADGSSRSYTLVDVIESTP